MRISDWSSEVCSSDLIFEDGFFGLGRIGVAVQRRLVVDARHQQARFALGHFLHPALQVAQWRSTVLVVLHQFPAHQGTFGRASCRERVCQYLSIYVSPVALKKNTMIINIYNAI